MLHTPLIDEHRRLHARLVDFAGWELPVTYSSIVDEHVATRTRAGLFDVSHMGQIRVQGADAERLLRRLLPTSLDRVAAGRCMYSCFCTPEGGVIDDLFVYRCSAQEFLLVVNAATRHGDLAWLHEHASGDVLLTDESDQTAKIDLQGPRADEVLAAACKPHALPQLPRFAWHSGVALGESTVMLSRSGYTGEAGFELYVPAAQAVAVWRSLLTAGEPFGLVPVGLGARNTLRLEACYSLYGHELAPDISPVEAGLGWLVNSTDEYVGRSVVREQKRSGAPRQLICFRIVGRGVPRDGYPVLLEGQQIGQVTSGSFSPSLQQGIGLALVSRGAVATGSRIDIEIRDRPVAAEVVKRPFYAFNG